MWFSLLETKIGQSMLQKEKDYGYMGLTTSIFLGCQWNCDRSNDCGGVLHS